MLFVQMAEFFQILSLRKFVWRQIKELKIQSIQKEEPLLLEIRNFLDAIESKNELIVKPEHAVNVTRIAEAALLSSQKGIPIYLDIK